MNRFLATAARIVAGIVVLFGAGMLLLLGVGCALGALDGRRLPLAACAALCGAGTLFAGNAAVRLLFNRPRAGGGLLSGFVLRLCGLYVAAVPVAWLAASAEKRPFPWWVCVLLLPVFVCMGAAFFERAAGARAATSERKDDA